MITKYSEESVYFRLESKSTVTIVSKPPLKCQLSLIFIVVYPEKFRSDANETWSIDSTECQEHLHQLWSNSKSSSKTDFS